MISVHFLLTADLITLSELLYKTVNHKTNKGTAEDPKLIKKYHNVTNAKTQTLGVKCLFSIIAPEQIKDVRKHLMWVGVSEI